MVLKYRYALLVSLVAAPLFAQAMPPLQGKEQLWLLTEQQQLIQVAASQPDTVLQQQTLEGLATGEKLIGIDYRVAYGILFGLSDVGQLYQINTATGQVTKVGERLASGTLQDAQFGFDFNPAADRIRVVNALGQNLRLHPETGALAATDPDLHYAATDPNAGKSPQIVAAAYTYNQQNEKLTTNYAIDIGNGNLVTQGSYEGVEPVISPNTGTLFTVGSLGLSPMASISFDISDLRNIGLISVSYRDRSGSFLYQVDLSTGQTQRLGAFAPGLSITGMAIEP